MKKVRVKRVNLDKISEKELLETRICDLPVKIEGTWLEECVSELYRELKERNLKFRPLCYLTDEWLTPDGEPVIGIPFYLAHPTLTKLERKMMLEVEGSTEEWCMKLLRHEAGHAINYAFKLHKRRKWKKVFGEFTAEYPEHYRFRPYSRSFVRHLENYYAQYHPDEDFAETFAVWLTPESGWQERYKGWKALAKLKYVDELMKKIAGKEPAVKKGKPYWQARKLKSKLKNYYNRKMHYYAEDFPDFHDTNLRRIFLERTSETKKLPLASAILKRYKKEILESVSRWTGAKKYVIDDLFQTIIERCRKLQLVAPEAETETVLRVAAYITALIANYMHTGRYRG